MGRMIPSVLRVALRAWIARQNRTPKGPYRPPVLGWPEQVLVLDMETTTEASQRLLFGSWRIGNFGAHGEFECLEEGLLYADDLPTFDPKGWAILQAYVKHHAPATRNRRRPELLLLSRRAFVQDRLWKVLDGGALIVGYNLAFDLTRLAIGVGESRHPMFQGGFSVALFEWENQGTWEENSHRPRFRMKPLDSKRTLMGLGRRMGSRPEERRQPLEALGRFLDLKHLAFALTDKHLSLAKAATAFGLPIGKLGVEEHGVITEAYIDYNRQDVEVTASLLEALRVEWERHPLALSPDKVMSPAGLGKGYLRAMGVVPPGRKFDDLGNMVLGMCMTAYFGGRTEVRVRRQVVPVVYVDFLSMYPTVNALLGLWRMLTAERLKLHDATAAVRELVATLTLDRCFQRAFWGDLRFFAKIRPQGDILPVRAAYGPTEDNPTIGLNPLTSDTPVWVAGPDLVASVLLTGHHPDVLEAVRLAPVGQQTDLAPVVLRGQVEIDPRKEDFFQRVIEERQRAKRRPDLTAEERERLQRFLKVVANSASYGIFAELNPQPTLSDAPEAVEVYGLDGMFPTTTRSPEEPGEFCFPPFAALTTAGARLMLAMLECCVRELGGEIAFGDTDSAAVVATREGGVVPCPGGPERLPNGEPAIRAFTWDEVRGLSARFRALSPYDPDIVTDSILKIEDVNVDPVTKEPRQLYAFAISAKRYALFEEGEGGEIRIVEAKEHGLGHLLNPMDLGQENRQWIPEVWAALIREAQGGPLLLPLWVDRPALARVTVSTFGIFHTYAAFNEGKRYLDAVKPMNFGLSPTVARFGHPEGVDPERFHLLGSYEKDPNRWLAMPWYDKYSGKAYRIGVGRETPGDVVQVKSYRDIIEEYRVHPEPKSLDAEGKPCDQASRGLLRRRPVELGELVYVGKESNAFEQVGQGLIHSRRDVQPTYPPPQPGLWEVIFLPALRRVPLKRLKALTGVGSRLIRYWWKGQRQPTPDVEKQLRAEAVRWAGETLSREEVTAEDRQVAERVLAVSPRPAPSRPQVAAARRSRRRAGG
ncbi:MAG: hypothetical protein IPG75_19810 [Gemmatimonadetes bacterium]|nr:hypothetical protein [Gemmatimonadota bacterium]